MSPFCDKEKLDNILALRKSLLTNEIELAKIGEKALYAYYEGIGKGSVPENRRITVHLGSDGTHLVYDLGGNTIELVPTEFLLSPDEFLSKYRDRQAELDREVCHENKNKAELNSLSTIYP